MIRKLLVFRHGQTDWNLEGRIQGHIDIPLNESGRAEARALAPHIGRLSVQAILSSDLVRAKETAEIVAQRSEIPVFTDAGLREIHLGQMQGLTRSEIEVRFGREFAARMSASPLTEVDVTALGSESGEEVAARAIGAILRFLKSSTFECVGIATHGGVIRRLVQHAMGDGKFPAPIPNGILYPFEIDCLTQILSLEASIFL